MTKDNSQAARQEAQRRAIHNYVQRKRFAELIKPQPRTQKGK